MTSRHFSQGDRLYRADLGDHRARHQDPLDQAAYSSAPGTARERIVSYACAAYGGHTARCFSVPSLLPPLGEDNFVFAKIDGGVRPDFSFSLSVLLGVSFF